MTLGNIYTSEAPLPRSFECAMCGSDVTVTERRKKTCSGHVTRLRREHDENRREAGL